MGPFSDLNDSGNEPPLSYGCQGLLLSWLPRSQELSCQPDPLRAGQWGVMPWALQGTGEERRLRGAGNG